MTERDASGRFRAPIEERSLRPNANDPADVPPATVGPPDARPGDPDGVEIIDEGPPIPPPRVFAAPWSGWPDEWATPAWGQLDTLVDAAWMCVDLNASIMSTMPPYATQGTTVVAPPTWMTNPDPDLYGSWDEFAKQLWWDYQLGEAFVICTSRYADGYPARFHVLEPWLVDVEMGGDGRRRYRIGSIDPGPDLLHIRYKSTSSSAHGVGPLDAGRARMVAAGLLQRYAARVVESGGIPYYVMKHPIELGATTDRRPATAVVAVTHEQPWDARGALRWRRDRDAPAVPGGHGAARTVPVHRVAVSRSCWVSHRSSSGSPPVATP